MNVTVLVSHYLPGFKAGGPVRSIANLVDRLGDEINFHIVAADRDIGDRQPYPAAHVGAWQRVGKAQVMYLPPSRLPPRRLTAIVRDARADLLYCNGFFNLSTCALPLLLRRLGRLLELPVIIAPRGEFSPGALALKRWKKAPYLAAVKSLGLNRGALWHATSDLERLDIERVMDPTARITVAPNLSSAMVAPAVRTEAKRRGELKLVFLSRIVPKKNFLGALEILTTVPGRVRLDVWGPLEDPAYWHRCRRAIEQLPANVAVCHRGALPPDDVQPTLAQYDALLFPTHGENYGHVIVEALAAACPVVISDATPWRDLQRQSVGWDLPLADLAGFRRALASLADMDEAAHSQLRRRAARFAQEATQNPADVDASRSLFTAALGAAPHRRRAA